MVICPPQSDQRISAAGTHISHISQKCRDFYLTMLQKAGGRETSWKPPKCDWCNLYLHRNPLSRLTFSDWREPGDYTSLCIHCAVAFSPDGLAQWRSPGELAGGDPREWTPFDDDDEPAALYLAFCETAFWNMVWTQRATRLAWNTCEHCKIKNDSPLPSEDGRSWWCRSCGEENDWIPEPPYDGGKNPDAEDATARRLPQVISAFDAGDWHKGHILLLPVAAPGWASYEDEPERMLAFRPDNCEGVAKAWSRLIAYRRDVLPDELKNIIDSPDLYLSELPPDSIGRWVPSHDELGQEETEWNRVRREAAINMEREKERLMQDEILQREVAARHQEKEKERWAELNKWRINPTGE